MRYTLASDGYCARHVVAITNKIASPIAALRFIDSSLRALQLSELFHQLLFAESGEFYRKFGVIAVPFAAKDDSFAIFGMSDLLSGAKTALATGLGNLHFRTRELLPTRSKKLGDVFDRVGGGPEIGGPPPAVGAVSPRALIVIVFGSLVRVLAIVAIFIPPRP